MGLPPRRTTTGKKRHKPKTVAKLWQVNVLGLPHEAMPGIRLDSGCYWPASGLAGAQRRAGQETGAPVSPSGERRGEYLLGTNKLVVEISELVETAVQFTRALPLFFSHVVTTCESAPPEMRLRIASPPCSGEATAVFLVRLCLDLSDACIHFATRPLAFYVAALVALFKLKTLCRGGKGSTTTH